jgi:hypothetical protein
MWGALSGEMTGLSLTIPDGPRQRSHSRVRLPWDPGTYFTVSNSRLPFCRLLPLAELRWRYSTPPPHWILSCLANSSCFITFGRLRTEHLIQGFSFLYPLLTVHVRVVPETCMNRYLETWVVPCLAPEFRLSEGVYRAIAWQWTSCSDSTTAAFRSHVTIYWTGPISPRSTHLLTYQYFIVSIPPHSAETFALTFAIKGKQLTSYRTVIATYTTCFNIKKSVHFAHKVYLCVSYDCKNKEGLNP